MQFSTAAKWTRKKPVTQSDARKRSVNELIGTVYANQSSHSLSPPRPLSDRCPSPLGLQRSSISRRENEEGRRAGTSKQLPDDVIDHVTTTTWSTTSASKLARRTSDVKSTRRLQTVDRCPSPFRSPWPPFYIDPRLTGSRRRCF